MDDKKKQQDAAELGRWLGRREAFSMIAGRCSAADAQCLRELRESKKYKVLGLNWEDCCRQRVGIPRSSAEAIIRNLEEFGPDYFMVAQVTGVSAKEYRRMIQGSVRNHALVHAGEEIPIQVENAQRLITAVEALRREYAERPAAPFEAERCFAKAERALRTGSSELERLRLMPLDADGRMRLQSVIEETTVELKLIGLQVKVEG